MRNVNVPNADHLVPSRIKIISVVLNVVLFILRPKEKRNQMVKYKDVGDDWISPIYRCYTLICCDCGLTHKIDFRIKNGKIQIKIKRNNISTANARRKNKQ